MQLGLPGSAFSSMIPPSLEKYETAEVLHGQSQEAREEKGTATQVEAPEGKEETGGQGTQPRREQQDQEDGIGNLPVAVMKCLSV